MERRGTVCGGRGRARCWGIGVAVLVVAAGAAWGDVLIFKHGGRTEGIVIEETPEQVILRLKHGIVRVERGQVAAVVRARPEANSALVLEWAAREVPVRSAAVAPAAPEAPPLAVGVSHEELQVEGGGHLVFLPRAAAAGTRWPLVLSLHDAEQSPWELARCWQNLFPTLDVLLAIPASPSGWTEPDADRRLLAILDALEARYPIAPGRVLVTGFAAGADLAYVAALRHPERFAAVCAIGGSLARARGWVGWRPATGAGRRLPILILHGSDDRVVPFAEAGAAAEQLTALGHHVQLVNLYEGHQYPVRENRRVVNWFLGATGNGRQEVRQVGDE